MNKVPNKQLSLTVPFLFHTAYPTCNKLILSDEIWPKTKRCDCPHHTLCLCRVLTVQTSVHKKQFISVDPSCFAMRFH